MAKSNWIEPKTPDEFACWVNANGCDLDYKESGQEFLAGYRAAMDDSWERIKVVCPSWLDTWRRLRNG